MKKHFSFLMAIVCCIAIAFASCNNQQVSGCTDPNAINYDPDATQDDGSCQYNNNNNTNNTAGIVFWFTASSAASYMSDSITSLNFIVDGVNEGTHNLAVTDASAPACDAANHVTIKRTVPQNTVQFIPYVITSQAGDSIIVGQFQFLGGSCYAVEITY